MRHDRTAIAVQGHDLVARQGMQHRADTRATDPEHLTELVLDQSRTRQQPMGRNRGMYPVIDLRFR